MSKKQMRILIKLEEVMLLIFSIVLFAAMDVQWWIFIAFLFVPDISMLGYLVNTRFGAILYNIVHHRAVSIIIYLLSLLLSSSLGMIIGIILFAHQTMDRIVGFGLKYFDNFKHTHLSEETSVSN